MSHQASAEIIAFPTARLSQRQPALAANDAAQQRLVRAMESLQASLEEQRQAVAAWRSSLESLKTVTASLGQGLHRYRERLDTLQIQVGAVHQEAVRLERWADTASGAQG